MTARPDNKQAAGAWGTGGSVKNSHRWETITEGEIKGLARGLQVATIDKGRGSQLRVLLSAWRGLNRVEIREATEICPGTAFPTKSGVLVPINLVDELVSALMAAKAKAIALGLLKDGRAER